MALVGPNPDGSGARTMTVEPLPSLEQGLSLRLLEWSKATGKVERATGGRVAYVYLPDTRALGYSYFRRYFYSQLDKDGASSTS
jgi:tricorn protease